MPIDLLPDAPSPSDPATFDAKADAFVAALPKAVGQFNAALGLLTGSNNQRIVDVVDVTGLALATAYANGQTIDGQVLTTGMRILRAVPGGDATNGIYDAPAAGIASRSIDANSEVLIPSGLVVVSTRGTAYAKVVWLHTTTPGFVLNATALKFQPFNKKATFTLLTSGTSYATKAFCTRIKVTQKGADGGPGGAASANGSASASNGTNGGDTPFNSIVAAGGGFGGGATTDFTTCSPGAGGAPRTGTGSTNVVQRIPGKQGEDGRSNGTGAFGPGQARGGSQGAGGVGSGIALAGGGNSAEGETVVQIIDNPTGNYTYAIGAHGSIGADNGGSGLGAATVGKDGWVLVEEFY